MCWGLPQVQRHWVYAELIRSKEVAWASRTHTFNLDEYYPIDPDSFAELCALMKEHLFNHGYPQKRCPCIPDGTMAKRKYRASCPVTRKNWITGRKRFASKPGVGRTGHIGFNEPKALSRAIPPLGSSRSNQVTRIDACRRDLHGEENVPRKAITDGCWQPILKSQADYHGWRGARSQSIHCAARAVEGRVTDQVPSTFFAKPS